MHRIEEGALIVSCDFCGTDWDGQSPVIEGHRGSVICLSCLQRALKDLAPPDGPYACTLCLRERIPTTVERWAHSNHPTTYACKSCVLQTADVFDRDPDVEFKWTGRPTNP